MPFDPLCQLQLTEEWQTTPPTQGNHFRFGYANNLGFSYLVVAQAQVGDDGLLELFGAFRFNLKGQGADIAELDTPRVFSPEHRRLAVRGLGSRNQSGKTLDLSIGETSMIINPSRLATSSSLTNFPASDTLSREAVPENYDRNGGLILNKTSQTLYLGFGKAAEWNNSTIHIKAGGMMDIPVGYVGPINALFHTVDLGNSVAAQILEFI